MKILHILSMMPIGGVGNYLKNIVKNINSDYQMEMLIPTDKRDGAFVEYMNSSGVKINYILPISMKNIFSLKKECKEFFKQNDYDIVELHSMNMSFLFLRYVSKYTHAKIIIHAHSTKLSNSDSFMDNARNYILSQPMKRYANAYISCGELVAEKALISRGIKKDNIFVMPNPINAVQEEEVTNEYRESLGLEQNDKCCLSIGNFLPTKNHKYMVEIFELLKDKELSIKLLLAGEGDLKNDIEKMAKAKSLDNVVFLGYRKDIHKILNVADVVIMPSIFEGVPVSAIETQSLGIPFVMSNNISNEVKINDNVAILPIDSDSITKWAETIYIFAMSERVSPEAFKKSKYNINNSIKELERFYSNL